MIGLAAQDQSSLPSREKAASSRNAIRMSRDQARRHQPRRGPAQHRVRAEKAGHELPRRQERRQNPPAPEVPPKNTCASRLGRPAPRLAHHLHRPPLGRRHRVGHRQRILRALARCLVQFDQHGALACLGHSLSPSKNSAARSSPDYAAARRPGPQAQWRRGQKRITP